MNHQKLQTYFFLALLVAIGVLTLKILFPFLAPLVIAATFAVIFEPLYTGLFKVVRQKSIASFLATLLVFVIVVAPLTLFGVLIFQEASDLYFTLENQRTALPDSIRALSLERGIVLPSLSNTVTGYTREILNWLFDNAGTAFTSVIQFGVSSFLCFLALYYFFKDGGRFRAALISLSPLLDAYDEEIFDRLKKAVNSVIQGALAIALLQGVATALGFTIFGVPHAALWGSAAIVAALIPQVGTALVILPAIAYLLFINNLPASIGLTIWGVLIVGTLDNLLRPKLLERGLSIHPFLILLAVLGGIVMFGPVGFLLGPLVLSLLFALIDIYRVLILKKAHSHEEV